MAENFKQNISEITRQMTDEARIPELSRDFMTKDEIHSRNEGIVERFNDKVIGNFFQAFEVLKLARESGQITEEDFLKRLKILDSLSNESIGYAISSLAIDRYNQDNLPYIAEKENYKLKQAVESEYVIGSFKFFNGELYYNEEVDDHFTDLRIAHNSGEFQRKETLTISDKFGIKYFGFWKDKAILVDYYNAMALDLGLISSEESKLLKWDLLNSDRDIASAQLLPDSRLAIGTKDGKIFIYSLENMDQEPVELILSESPISFLSVYRNTLFAAEGKNRDQRFRNYGTFKVDLDSPELSYEMIYQRPENQQENIQAVSEDIYFYTSAGFASICRKEDGKKKWFSKEWARGDAAPIQQYKVLLKGEKFIRVDRTGGKYSLTYFNRSGEIFLSEEFEHEIKQVQIIPDGRIFVLSDKKIFVYDGEVQDE